MTRPLSLLVSRMTGYEEVLISSPRELGGAARSEEIVLGPETARARHPFAQSADPS